MTTESPIVYLDSCVVVSYLKGDPDRIAMCKAAFRDAQTGVTRGLTSAFSLAEVIKLDVGYLSEEHEEKIDEFFKHPWIQIALVDRRVATKAREVSRKYRIKPPDAIHIATALLYRATNFFTYDDKLVAKVKDKIPELAFGEPKGQLMLDLSNP